MDNLVKIASDIKEIPGANVINLKGPKGFTSYPPVFSAILFEVTNNEEGKIIINFNMHYKQLNLHQKESEEYKAIKEFCIKNDYKLILKNYDMTFPRSPPGILY